MSLLDDIDSYRSVSGTPCSIRSLFDTLPPEDAAELRSAIEATDAGGRHIYQASQISRALSRRGVKLSDSTISRHRRRMCVCP